jgi:hypothetical protein
LRSSDVCTLALAERVCGAPDRLDPPGMPGPHRGDRRGSTCAISSNVTWSITTRCARIYR